MFQKWNKQKKLSAALIALVCTILTASYVLKQQNFESKFEKLLHDSKFEKAQELVQTQFAQPPKDGNYDKNTILKEYYLTYLEFQKYVSGIKGQSFEQQRDAYYFMNSLLMRIAGLRQKYFSDAQNLEENKDLQQKMANLHQQVLSFKDAYLPPNFDPSKDIRAIPSPTR